MGAHTLRVLIDPSSLHCLNLGDVAMLQFAVRRFREFWPDAEIFVFTEAPDLLKSCCPGAKSIDPVPRLAYYTVASGLTRLGRHYPCRHFPSLT